MGHEDRLGSVGVPLLIKAVICRHEKVAVSSQRHEEHKAKGEQRHQP